MYICFKKLFQKFKAGAKYSSRKVCCYCKQDDDNCLCETPKFGSLLDIPLKKPIEAIVTSISDKKLLAMILCSYFSFYKYNNCHLQSFKAQSCLVFLSSF